LILPTGVYHARTAEEALHHASAIGGHRICIGGGGEIYRLYLPMADRLYLSEIDATVDGDVRFPDFSEHDWTPIASET
ncbi:dihydrofolate reductase, partial [Acinetobacter baumannii]